MGPVGACNIILEGLPRKLNLEGSTAAIFLLMGASGLMHMWFTALMSGSSGSQEGCLISLTALGRGLTYRSSPLEIELDSGKKINGYGTVVGNMKYYGGDHIYNPLCGYGTKMIWMYAYSRARGSGTYLGIHGASCETGI